MDHQKTGALIARRRADLYLTQKELAEKLSVSDRTVSKWERGAGFPDISLVEPLADALGLSVLELLHGEESPETIPGSDSSARETLRALWPEVGARLRRAKRLLTVLAVLLAIAAVALTWLVSNPTRGYHIFSENITAAQATDICPFLLITTEEYQLLSEMAADPDINSCFAEGTILEIAPSVSERYRECFLIDGVSADTFILSVIGHSLYAEGTVGEKRCILSLYTVGGNVNKTISKYNGSEPIYILSNLDNREFSQAVSKRDLLAPFHSP